MKKIILAFLLTIFNLNVFSATWVVTSPGNTFSPASLTIKFGDNVNFSIASWHNAVEVSQAVWSANENSPEVGFMVPYGGGIATPQQLQVGTHYYVCTPHAALGMKGVIIVQAATGLDETLLENNVSVFPNPIVDQLNVRLNLKESSNLDVKLYDVQGKLVQTLLPKTSTSGTSLQSFPISNELNPGVYFVRMTLGNNTTYRKVIRL
jgi:plastocyanin